jgi:hypothetical protein
LIAQAMQAAGLDPATIGTGPAPGAEATAATVAEDSVAAAADEAARDDINLALAEILPDGRF